MRYDAEHKSKTRERVLVETAKAIRADGPHRVAVAGVMAKAGLTHGGFYAHFKSRDELITAGVGQMFKEGQQLFRDVADGAGLTAYIDRYLSRAHRDSREISCPLPFLSADAPRLPDEARQRYSRGVAGLTALLVQQLASLDWPEPEAAASSMVAELVGALVLARAEPDPERSDLILIRSRRALKRRFGLETAA